VDDSNRGSLGTYLLYLFTVISVIILLGAWGFYFFEIHADKTMVHNYGDCLWWAIVTITTIGYGDVYPVTLGGRLIAVFLMFTGISALSVLTAAIAASFVKNDQLQWLRIRTLHNHVILCGLGDKGLLLAKAFRERGQAVVIIEKNEANELIEVGRELGAFVVIGDATEPEMLTRARIGEAKYLIAVCGDDGANAGIAAHARDLAGQRKGGSLTCSIHIVDPELWYLLRKWEIATVSAFRLQFFNVFDIGGRAMLNAYPPFEMTSGEMLTAPHILVVGSRKLAQNVVVHTTRLWRDSPHASHLRLRVSIVDKDTAMLKESIYLRHPGLEKVCDIETYTVDVKSPEFHHGAFLYDAHKHFLITAAYICLDEDTEGLSAALALLHRARQHRIPIVVRMNQDAGLATLLHGAQDTTRSFTSLHAFALLEKACQPELVLGGTNEALARAIHERYREDKLKAGEDKNNPSLVPWNKLSEETKESNRNEADHIGMKLQAIGCDIAPLTEWDEERFTFSQEEIDKLARMEHERWLAERRAQGWTYGPRDPAKKTNPNLLEWDQLPDAGKEFNRQDAASIPDLLARAGFQVYRL